MGVVISLALLGALQEEEDRYRRGIYWFSSVDQVSDAGRSRGGEEEGRRGRGRDPKKYVLLYVRPVHEARDPNLFNDAGLVRRSYEEWAFVKADLDGSDPRLKEWGIRRAPMIAGLDLHGNEFLKTPTVSIIAVRSLMKALPMAISRYQAKLRADCARAGTLLAANEGRGIAALRDIVSTGKHGYPEVEEARTLLEDHAEASLRKAELAQSVSLEEGLEYLAGLAKLYRETPHGARIEVRIARLERALGRTKEAEQRLKKLLKLDGPGFRAPVEDARALLLKLVR